MEEALCAMVCNYIEHSPSLLSRLFLSILVTSLGVRCLVFTPKALRKAIMVTEREIEIGSTEIKEGREEEPENKEMVRSQLMT